MNSGAILMSRKQQFKLDIVLKVEAGELDRKTAASALDVTERTIRRYLKSYKDQGIRFVIHGNAGRKPENSLSEVTKQTVLDLYKTRYYDFNMLHALEKINQQLNIGVKRETFRRWCDKEGLITRCRKRRSKGRKYRPRQGQEGLLIQMDGSHHKWFSNKETCLIITVDDANGEIVSARFSESENTSACLEVLKNHVKKKGAFSILYTDKAGVFGGIKRSGFAQVERALGQLGTKIIYANSPQAKGRVERIFHTLQDRLTPELRLARVKTIAQANRFLEKEFLYSGYNDKFTVTPKNPISAYRTLNRIEDLNSIFVIKEFRKVGRDHTVSFEGKKYLIDTRFIGHTIAGQQLEIRIDSLGHFEAYYGSQPAPMVPINQIPNRLIA